MAKMDTILAAYSDGILCVWRPHKHGWVEVRGTLDQSSIDPLQLVIDGLSGPLVGGELMAGNIASINERMYKRDYPILCKLLEE